MTAFWSWLGLAAAGGLGAVLRLLVDGAVSQRLASAMPVGTMAVNVSGALVLGLLDGFVLPPHAAMVVGTGLVGAYTTFSTWMFETQRLAEERQFARAAGNIAASVVAGLAAAVLGLWIGGMLR
jgi:CrcB protein